MPEGPHRILQDTPAEVFPGGETLQARRDPLAPTVGPQGPKGDKGDTGATGAAGPPGPVSQFTSHYQTGAGTLNLAASTTNAHVVILDNGGAVTLTVNLPALSANTQAVYARILRNGTIALTPNGADLIDNAAGAVSIPGASLSPSIMLVPDLANGTWWTALISN